VQSTTVVPVDPFQGCDLQVVDGPPGAFRADQFGLVESDDGLGERVVVGIAGGADRTRRAGVDESFGVADGCIFARVQPVVATSDY